MVKKDPDHITARMEILDFVNSKTEEEDLSWISPVNVEHARKFLVELPEEVADIGDAEGTFRIADIGCGRGELTKEIAEKYKEVDAFGIDISAEAVKSAIIKLDDHNNGFAIGGNANKLLSELEDFNFIYAINVVQDSTKPIKLMQKMAENLEHGGHIAMTIPGENALEMFPEHRDFDDKKSLPFMIMEDINAEGEEIIWKQYAIPREKLKENLEKMNLKIDAERKLPADASGLPKLMKLLEKDERVNEAEKIASSQDENPEKGPKVNFYLLKKRCK